jgi:hypothetical protein
MLRILASASLLATAALAQGTSQWYGLSPDDTVPGVVNIFKMTPTGQVTAPVATVVTKDNEYPKVSTLHVSYTRPIAYFATGVGANYIQDALYAINTTTGAVIFRHELPAGLYIDNLAYDYIQERLFSISFNPAAPGGVDARIVEWDANTGNVTEIADISRDLRGGFVFGGAFSICPTTKMIYVGVDAADGEFNDFILDYSYAGPRPVIVGGRQLEFPIPSSLRAVCGANALEGMYGPTVQADSADRETAMIGDIINAGREGLYVPLVKGDLPSFSQRGFVPAYLNGLYTFHEGTAIAPFYAPYVRGQPIPFGAIWTVTFAQGGPPQEQLTPIAYYLAGAAGVPV